MADARLIKALEREGFFLEFPLYQSQEEIITAILKDGNPRILPSLPLFLRSSFNYAKVISRISKRERKVFDKAIGISARIYRKEKIEGRLRELIRKHGIKARFTEGEFKEFYEAYQEAQLKKRGEEQREIEEQSRLRLRLDLQESLQTLFSPAKLRIMEAIFNHRPLSNTELKYYYKAISPINRAVLNKALQGYLQVIENVKKRRSELKG